MVISAPEIGTRACRTRFIFLLVPPRYGVPRGFNLHFRRVLQGDITSFFLDRINNTTIRWFLLSSSSVPPQSSSVPPQSSSVPPQFLLSPPQFLLSPPQFLLSSCSVPPQFLQLWSAFGKSQNLVLFTLLEDKKKESYHTVMQWLPTRSSNLP